GGGKEQNRTRRGRGESAERKEGGGGEVREGERNAGTPRHYEQEQGTKTETTIDDERFDRLAKWEVHPVQEPEPHRVPADKAESDLLDEETAKRDLRCPREREIRA